MTLERRLAKLEGSLSPQEAVLAWLAEAHQYPTLPVYVRVLLDAPREAWPLVRIARQVEASVRAATKGSGDEVWQKVRRAVGDAFFLFELVLKLNLAAEEILRFEGLRWACLSQQMRAVSLQRDLAEVTKGREHAAAGPSISEVDAWRNGLARALTTVSTEEEARTRHESRYLDGRPALFPALATEWDELRGRLEGLAGIADKVRELRGRDLPTLALDDLRNAAGKAAEARAVELTEQARVGALDTLGESGRAAAIVEQRLRGLDAGDERTAHAERAVTVAPAE